MVETLASVGSAASMLANRFEPKRKYRFILEIDGLDAYMIKTTARPTITHEEITIDWINVKRYLAGKLAFETLNVTLYDPIAPSGAQQVMEWVRLCTEQISGRSGYSDFYKRDIRLKMLDGVGNVVELWDIIGAWLTNVTFGDTDYAASDAVEINLTIRYDSAVLQY